MGSWSRSEMLLVEGDLRIRRVIFVYEDLFGDNRKP